MSFQFGVTEDNRRRDADAGMRHQIPLFLRLGRLQALADAFGEGGVAAHEHRHVGAEAEPQRCQLVVAKTAAPQFVERHQHGGGVGEPPPRPPPIGRCLSMLMSAPRGAVCRPRSSQ